VLARAPDHDTFCHGETTLPAGGERRGMVQVDPVLVGIVVVMLVAVFAVYLFLRRIATGFREGVQRGRGGNR